MGLGFVKKAAIIQADDIDWHMGVPPPESILRSKRFNLGFKNKMAAKAPRKEFQKYTKNVFIKVRIHTRKKCKVRVHFVSWKSSIQCKLFINGHIILHLDHEMFILLSCWSWKWTYCPRIRVTHEFNLHSAFKAFC